MAAATVGDVQRLEAYAYAPTGSEGVPCLSVPDGIAVVDALGGPVVRGLLCE